MNDNDRRTSDESPVAPGLVYRWAPALGDIRRILYIYTAKGSRATRDDMRFLSLQGRSGGGWGQKPPPVAPIPNPDPPLEREGTCLFGQWSLVTLSLLTRYLSLARFSL